MTTKIKDPNATLDYLFNWGDWLVPGDTIVSKVVTADAGLTVSSSAIVAGTDRDGVSVPSGAVLVWITGGTLGAEYKVVCNVTTASAPPRIDDRTMTFVIQQR